MKRIVVFGGTTEGRALSYRLADAGAAVTVCVATPYGAEEQGEHAGVTVLVGRKTAAEMTALLGGDALCVDATHPYAREATENIRAACAAAEVPYRRLLRRASAAEGAVYVNSAAEAAAFLQVTEGNVLLATGAKELSAFAPLGAERLYARVLPSHEGIAACEAAGVPHRRIIAMQGPFSRELNEAVLRQFGIAWLVTKDGGAAGGFPEKAAAARAVGAKLVVLRRPADAGADFETVAADCERWLKCE
ncbi:MAG: precorrin-6A reductase [Oscillospiraceae bacterium]|nr:precorrin-6A reductase [Oscillospiraceae bacterium]